MSKAREDMSMSRLWDTPEFWARSEADEALREMPDMELGAMADSLKKARRVMTATRKRSR